MGVGVRKGGVPGALVLLVLGGAALGLLAGPAAPAYAMRRRSENMDYPGMFSSHSWSTDDALPRIYKLGGVVTPYAGNAESFVHKWEHLRTVREELGGSTGSGTALTPTASAPRGTRGRAPLRIRSSTRSSRSTAG